MRRSLFTALAIALLAATASAAAEAAVPERFFGVMADGPLLAGGVNLPKETALMRSSGVETMRMPIEWPDLQPFAKFSDVPARERSHFVDVGGIPTAFAATDARIKAAALSDVEVLALVMRSPLWAGRDPREYMTPPRDPVAYGRFLATLIARYGPAGSFWAENPDLPRHPLRIFQIWNEPNLTHFFPMRGWAPAYAKLLRASYEAIKAADRGATVVTAGMPNFVWSDYAKLFKAGMRPTGYFDAVAVHPYTDTASGAVKILQMVRAVLDANGARQAPIWVTEAGWPSARGKSKVLSQHQGWITTPAGEAAKVAQLYRVFASKAASLKLARAYWYTWISRDRSTSNAWDYAGLRSVARTGSFTNKPALAAYRAVALSLRATAR